MSNFQALRLCSEDGADSTCPPPTSDNNLLGVFLGGGLLHLRPATTWIIVICRVQSVTYHHMTKKWLILVTQKKKRTKQILLRQFFLHFCGVRVYQTFQFCVNV